MTSVLTPPYKGVGSVIRLTASDKDSSNETRKEKSCQQSDGDEPSVAHPRLKIMQGVRISISRTQQSR